MSDMINTETINKLIISGFIPLNSVGSLLDSDTGECYPQLEDGSPDWDNSFSLYDEVSEEWIDALSIEDFNQVKVFW
jgi:hypothetical protein